MRHYFSGFSPRLDSKTIARKSFAQVLKEQFVYRGRQNGSSRTLAVDQLEKRQLFAVDVSIVLSDAFEDPTLAAYGPILNSRQTFSGSELVEIDESASGFANYVDIISDQALATFSPDAQLERFASTVPTIESLKHRLVGSGNQAAFTDLQTLDEASPLDLQSYISQISETDANRAFLPANRLARDDCFEKVRSLYWGNYLSSDLIRKAGGQKFVDEYKHLNARFSSEMAGRVFEFKNGVLVTLGNDPRADHHSTGRLSWTTIQNIEWLTKAFTKANIL